jgi:preprotein translocase subunit SecG
LTLVPWRAVISFLAVVQVLLSIALITLILLHSGRDAGLGGMGYTPASQGGTHIVERNLTRLTVIVAILFAANCIALFHYLR